MASVQDDNSPDGPVVDTPSAQVAAEETPPDAEGASATVAAVIADADADDGKHSPMEQAAYVEGKDPAPGGSVIENLPPLEPVDGKRLAVHDDDDSTATPMDMAAKRRERCFFTIVIPAGVSGGRTPSDEFSDLGSDELNDDDRKHLANGEEYEGDATPRVPSSDGVGRQKTNVSGSNPGQMENQHMSPYMASADSKFEMYAVSVDRKQDDKASEIALCSMERPHMRGFHFAWMSMFVAFVMWFSITPLLSEIQISLNLSREEIWTSSIFGTVSTIVMRIFMGPLCDKYGSRLCMSILVFLSAIPAGLTGLINSANGLYMVRLCVGLAGASFVTCEYWTSSLFIKEIAGTANSLVSGWGNLGGGVAQILMGSVLFPLLKWAFRDRGAAASADMAWRLSFILPGVLGLGMGALAFKFSDDCPKGNYLKRERQGLRAPVSAMASLRKACWEYNTWVFVLQYACCFGVEFAMNNAAPLYFRERFGLSTEASAAVASIFGWMNLFARGLGGFVSDLCNARYGMRGRIMWMFVILFCEGVSIVFFGFCNSLAAAITVMVIFSLFVQAAEGSVYAIVPYIDPSATGSISGVVGAGGTVGGAIFAVLFREFSYELAFSVMGIAVAASSFLSFFLRIQGHANFRVCPCLSKGRAPRRPSRARQESADTTMEQESGNTTLQEVTADV